MANGIPSLTRRIGASLAFGFGVTFGFAILAQAAVDFVNDVLGIPMKLLLPYGLKGAFIVPDVLLDLIGGLVAVSLGVSVLFFFLIQRQANLARRRHWRLEDDD